MIEARKTKKTFDILILVENIHFCARFVDMALSDKGFQVSRS